MLMVTLKKIHDELLDSPAIFVNYWFPCHQYAPCIVEYSLSKSNLTQMSGPNWLQINPNGIKKCQVYIQVYIFLCISTILDYKHWAVILNLRFCVIDFREVTHTTQ